MKESPKVLVSILNHNNIKDTCETIDCFLLQTYGNCHIIVVDSASNNDCVDEIARRYPDIEMVCLGENLGYAGGNNYALNRAYDEGYDYVVLSNNDVSIADGMVECLVETAQKTPSCGVVGVVEEDYYNEKIRAVGGTDFKFWRSRGRWLKSPPDGCGDVVEYDYVQGAFLMFSRVALEAGVRFDDKLFMYGEEVDVGFQLKEKALRAVVDLRNPVKHKSLPRKYVDYQGYFMQRNRLYLCRKHASFPVYIMSILYGALFELPVKVVIRSMQGHFHYALICVKGFVDAMTGKMGIGRFGCL